MAEKKREGRRFPEVERVGTVMERVAGLHPFEEMERLYGTIFPHGWLRPFQWGWPSWEKARSPFLHRVPAMDIVDRETEILLRAEVPGVRREDLAVSLSDNALTVRGRIERPTVGRREDYLCREMGGGEFTRVVTLPAEVDMDRVCAKLKDGVLEIVLGKCEGSKRRAVEIDVE
jgi:HSP20 family protein